MRGTPASLAETAPASISPHPEKTWWQLSLRGRKTRRRVVLNEPSALAVNWIAEHANAVLDAWYPGEGRRPQWRNPERKVPLPDGCRSRFYKGVDQLPHFEDYGNGKPDLSLLHRKSRFIRSATGSATRNSATAISVPPEQGIAAGQPVEADVTVTNAGKIPATRSCNCTSSSRR